MSYRSEMVREKVAELEQRRCNMHILGCPKEEKMNRAQQ
jgi:hypothetical protein